MPDLLQWAVFVFACVVLLAWIEIDLRQSVRRKFMRLDLRDILSGHLLPVFLGPLDLGKHGHIMLAVRYTLWPLAIAICLFGIAWATVNVSGIGIVVEGALPHSYTEFKEIALQDEPLVQLSIVMVGLFALVRLPGDNIKSSREELAEETPTVRKFLTSYGAVRDRYVQYFLLKGKVQACRAKFILDIEGKRLDENAIAAKDREDLFEELRQECGQPANSTDHQILMGYIDARGANQLDFQLRTKMLDKRQEVRRSAMINVELRASGPQNDIHTTVVKQVGIIDQNCIQSLELETGNSSTIPNGPYSLHSFNGKTIKNGIGIVVCSHGNRKKYGSVHPKSPALCKEFRRHLMKSCAALST